MGALYLTGFVGYANGVLVEYFFGYSTSFVSVLVGGTIGRVIITGAIKNGFGALGEYGLITGRLLRYFLGLEMTIVTRLNYGAGGHALTSSSDFAGL